LQLPAKPKGFPGIQGGTMKRRRIAIGSTDAYAGISSGGSREHRGLRIVFGSILGLVVVGYAAGALALHFLLDAEEVSGWLGTRASAALNRQVTVEAADVSLFPRPGVDVSGVVIANLSGFEGPPLARIDRVRFGISFLPLFTGRVNVRSVLLERPQVHLATDAEGTTNFGDLVPQGAPDSSPSGLPISVGIEDVEVAAGRLSLVDVPERKSTTLLGVGAAAELSDGSEEGAWLLAIVVSSDSLTWRSPSLGDRLFHGAGPSLEMTAELDRSFAWMRVVAGSLRVGAAGAALQGRIDSIGSATRAVDVRLVGDSLGAAVVLAALPQEMQSGLPTDALGRLSFDVRLSGYAGPDTRPRRSGRIELAGVGVRQNGSALIEGVSGKIAIRGDTLVLDSIAGSLLGGPFTLEGHFRGEDRGFALRTAAHPDFDVLDRLGLVPEGTSLSGDVQVELTLAGSGAAPEDVQVDGTATLAGLQVDHSRLGVPVYVASGDLTLAGNDVSFTDMAVLVGQDRMTISGRVRRPIALMLPMSRGLTELEANLRGVRLDLDEVLPWTPDEPGETYAQIAFAHLGDRRLGGRPPRAVARDHGFSRPSSLPMAGRIDFALDTLEYRRYRMEEVSGRVLTAGDLLGVTDLSMRLWDGRVSGALVLSLGADEQQPFSLSLAVDGARAADFLAAMSPLDRAVDGLLGLDLQVSGTTDPDLLPVAGATSGSGRLSVLDGSFAINPLTGSLADFLAMDAWTRPPFEEWTLPFDLEDGRLRVAEVELRTELGRIRASGTVGLSGALDLAYGVTIPPERLGDLSLRRTGVSSSVVEGLRRAGDGLSLGFRVGGRVAAPLLEPDADLTDAGFPAGQDPSGASGGEADGPSAEELRERLEQRTLRLLESLFTARPDTIAS
jgi:hypothetical protein